MFGANFKNILVTGGTGNLGSFFKKSSLRKKAFFPNKKKLNILSKNKIDLFFKNNKFDIIIHCAALARMKDCELNKKRAYEINVKGTQNLVDISKKYNPSIKFVYVSSDAVYSCKNGNYNESSKLRAYNYYGKTKIMAEKRVQKMKNYLIIRTRFFNKKKIKFKDAATDSFSSSIEINLLIKYLIILINKNIKGILNVGGEKISDFDLYKNYKKNLKKTSIKIVQAKKKYKLSTDASMNCKKFQNIING